MASFNHNRSSLKVTNGENKNASAKTYSGIKPDAEDGKVFEVAGKLGGIQKEAITKIQRVDEYEIK